MCQEMTAKRLSHDGRRPHLRANSEHALDLNDVGAHLLGKEHHCVV